MKYIKKYLKMLFNYKYLANIPLWLVSLLQSIPVMMGSCSKVNTGLEIFFLVFMQASGSCLSSTAISWGSHFTVGWALGISVIIGISVGDSLWHFFCLFLFCVVWIRFLTGQFERELRFRLLANQAFTWFSFRSPVFERFENNYWKSEVFNFVFQK